MDFEKIKRVEAVLDLTSKENDLAEPVRLNQARALPADAASAELTAEKLLAELTAIYERDDTLEAELARERSYPVRTPPTSVGGDYTIVDETAPPCSESHAPPIKVALVPESAEPLAVNNFQTVRKRQNLVFEPVDGSTSSPQGRYIGGFPAPSHVEGSTSSNNNEFSDGLFITRETEVPSIPEPTWLPAPVTLPAVPMPRATARLSSEAQPMAWPARSERRRELKYFVAAVLGLAAVLIGLGFAGRVMAVKAVVEARVLVGFKRLAAAEESVENRDLAAARDDFQKASAEFQGARAALGWSGRTALFAARIWPLPSAAKNASRVLEVGGSLAAAGVDLATVAERFVAGGALKSLLGENQEDILVESREALERATRALDTALASSERISPEHLPAEARERFADLRRVMPVVTAGVRAAKQEFDLWAPMLGSDMPRRYLLVFQNSSELRPTGGFIGSYATVAIDQGRLKEFLVNGIFDPDGQLAVKVVPPRPLQLISTAWATRDANWFFDYPTSAKKIAWFFGKTGEPSVDGVIAFTPEALVRLLSLTGPIAMPAYDEVVSAENFIEVAQREVELEYDPVVNRPKQFLADLVIELLERLRALDPHELGKIISVTADSLAQKDILIYLADPERQAEVARRGFAGAVTDTSGDYLAVVHTNINGYKSDYVTDDELAHETAIWPDGSTINTVTVKRTHRGGKTPHSFWNQVNAEWLRVYAPLGSELISVSGVTRLESRESIDYSRAGFQNDADVVAEEAKQRKDPFSGSTIGEEAGKTVFGNWVFVKPGETVTVSYRYRLPFTLQNGSVHTLVWQKQPGTKARFSHRLQASGWRVEGEADAGGVLDRDFFTEVKLFR